MSRQHGRAPSQRQLRVGEEIRHVLAGLLIRGELHDPALDGRSITVSEVRISPDLKAATVFVSELGKPLGEAAAKALRRAAGLLAGQVGREMALRSAPRLSFVADERFEEAARFERVLGEARARLSDEAPLDDEAHPGDDGAQPGDGDDDARA